MIFWTVPRRFILYLVEDFKGLFQSLEVPLFWMVNFVSLTEDPFYKLVLIVSTLT